MTAPTTPLELQDAVTSLMEQFDAKDKALQVEVARLSWRDELTRVPLYEQRRELVKGLPEFWATVIARAMGETSSDEELDLLRQHLVDVWLVRDDKDYSAGKLTFFFSTNEHFSDAALEVSWKGGEEEDNWEAVYPKISWAKKLPVDEAGFFAWLEGGDDEDNLKRLVDSVYPCALELYMEDGESDDDDDEKSLDVSDSDEEDAKPAKKLKQ